MIVQDLLLSKAPTAIKRRLITNYDAGRSHNALFRIFDRSGEEDKERLSVLLKHIEKSEIMNVLNDVENPKLHHQCALRIVCAQGNKEHFAMIKRVYTEQKEDFDAELTRIDYKNESLMHKVIARDEDSICEDILNAIDSDAAKMKILNMRSASDHRNVFACANTKNSKSLLKKTVTSILKNIKTNKLKYNVFIPYFHWLITENDLESIKALFDVFKSSINKLIISRTPSRRNVIKLCCGSDENAELLNELLSNIRDKDLPPMLMHRDENDNTALSSASKKCEDVILKHVRSKDQSLLNELLSQDDYSLLRRHVSDKDELVGIFSYCDGRVLNEEVINKLLTACGWTKEKDEIRDEIVQKGEGFGVTKRSMYLHVDPNDGNIPLVKCMIAGNEKQFDSILESIDLEDKVNMEFLIGWTNFRDEVRFLCEIL